MATVGRRVFYRHAATAVAGACVAGGVLAWVYFLAPNPWLEARVRRDVTAGVPIGTPAGPAGEWLIAYTDSVHNRTPRPANITQVNPFADTRDCKLAPLSEGRPHVGTELRPRNAAGVMTDEVFILLPIDSCGNVCGHWVTRPVSGAPRPWWKFW